MKVMDKRDRCSKCGQPLEFRLQFHPDASCISYKAGLKEGREAEQKLIQEKLRKELSERDRGNGKIIGIQMPVGTTWGDLRERILEEIAKYHIEVASIPVINYKEVIEIRVPVRFYWDEDGFDGIEFGEFKTTLLPWQEAMIEQCLEAVGQR